MKNQFKTRKSIFHKLILTIRQKIKNFLLEKSFTFTKFCGIILMVDKEKNAYKGVSIKCLKLEIK